MVHVQDMPEKHVTKMFQHDGHGEWWYDVVLVQNTPEKDVTKIFQQMDMVSKGSL